jgi:4-amino-4-deoxy-L-arabinose transferase-like glycosyltransferase
MGRWCCTLLIGYLCGSAIYRACLWGHLEFDEAEQLVWVQTLSLGYASQPPLYTWLLWPLVQLLGVSVYPMLLLRTVLLGLAFFFTHRIARRLCGEPGVAWLATLSLLLLPEVHANMNGQFTHTLLLVVCTQATLLTVLRLHERPTAAGYVLLGACIGLGVLAKYNYTHFAAALVAALVTLSSWRPVVADRRLLLTAAAAACIAGPHLLWLGDHGTEAWVGVTNATYVRAHHYVTWQATALNMGTNLTQTFARGSGFALLPLVGLLGPALWPRAARPDADGARQLLGRVFVAAALLLTLVIVATDVRHLRQHWLVPFTALLPVWFLAHVDPGGVARWRLRAYGGVLALAAVGMLGLRIGLLVRHGEDGRLWAYDFLYAAQADELRAAGWSGGTAVADHPFPAAYLRLHFPGTQVKCLHYGSHHVPCPADRKPIVVACVGGYAAERLSEATPFVAEQFDGAPLRELSTWALQEDPRHYDCQHARVNFFVLCPADER